MLTSLKTRPTQVENFSFGVLWDSVRPQANRQIWGLVPETISSPVASQVYGQTTVHIKDQLEEDTDST